MTKMVFKCEGTFARMSETWKGGRGSAIAPRTGILNAFNLSTVFWLDLNEPEPSLRCSPSASTYLFYIPLSDSFVITDFLLLITQTLLA